MMKKINFSIVLAFLLLFTSCEDNKNELKPAECVARTVLIYMVGDDRSYGASDLSELLRGNFNDMLKGMELIDVSDCNVLVFSKLSNSSPCLIHLKNEGGYIVADTLYTYSDENPLGKQFMADVMSTSFSYFPAESYGFVFLSHAEGWLPAAMSASRSIGVYQNTSMNISDFNEVLSVVGQHLDFILFDACFMQSVEVAYELRDKVDYIIGSPTEIPGPGASYSQLMPCLFLKKDYAENIAKSYFQEYEKIYTGETPTNKHWTGGVSVSVIKTEALDDLALYTKNIFLNYNFDSNVSEIMCYDRRSSKYYYDLDGLVYHLTGGNNDYIAWKAVFDLAVPYWGTTSKNYSGTAGMFSMEGSSGVSTYIPTSSSSSVLTTYYKSYLWSQDTKWGQ